MVIGFHASHEQFSPYELLNLIQQAERAGFQAAMCSDHITPWSVNQGQSGFAWSWLGAAMQATRLPFGSLAIPGGWRYHPVVVAQAGATLAQMFPGRFQWIAAGSGEAMNEHVTGDAWPPKEIRNARLKAGVDMIRALWAGQTVTHEEAGIKIRQAKLWSLPETPPKIYGAALTPETAEWLGGWADGMLTVRQEPQAMQTMIAAFHRGGGAGKPLLLQMHLSWAETDEKARWQTWDQWRSAALGPAACAGLRTPEEFDRASKDIPPEAMDRHVLMSADPARHVAWIKEYAGYGFEDIFIHNSGRNQRDFITCFGKHVLPFL